jgi:SH3 domain protein
LSFELRKEKEKMTPRIWPILIAGLLFFYTPSLWAKTMYITDRIEVGVRSSTGIEQRIVTMVKTGDRVEVLEGDNNWTKVKLPNGTVGWLATRFLVDSVKPAPAADSKLQEDLRGLKEKNQALTQEKDGLVQEKSHLVKELEEVKKQNGLLAQERKGVATPALQELTAKNEKLEKEIINYKRQLAEPGRMEKNSTPDSQVKWFLAGSGVLFLGLLLGWLTGRVRRKPNRFY